MGTLFDDKAFEQFMEWIRENRKSAERLNELIKDIHRNGAAHGIGKPEHLKYIDAWSRRIDHGNRLVYKVNTNGDVHVLSCKGHYED